MVRQKPTAYGRVTLIGSSRSTSKKGVQYLATQRYTGRNRSEKNPAKGRHLRSHGKTKDTPERNARDLVEQVTFSVYTKDHHGIGRGVEDIKAKIEVTRVLGPHMAEARILEEDLYRPIGEDDPIYSPLWSAGRTEFVALIGRPDLDEDGTGDWAPFYEIVQNAGAEVDFIVSEEGLRIM